MKGKFIILFFGLVIILINVFYALITPFGMGYAYLQTNVLFFGYILIITIMLGMMDYAYRVQRKNSKSYPISMWSLVHLISPLEVYLLSYLILGNMGLSLIISIGYVVLVELVEKLWSIFTIESSFSDENLIGRIIDIIVGLVGIGIAWYISL
jgi:hypothetical protein